MDAASVRLKLPYPVSANRYWRSYVPKGWTRATVYVSDEAKAYKQQVGWLAKAAGCRAPLTVPIELWLRLYPKDGRRLDLSNCIKVAEDALSGIVYVDDKQVRKLTAELFAPDGEPRLEVYVAEYITPTGPLL